MEHEVEIDAPAERVWRALTEAADLEHWFPLEARVEPGEGGTIWMSWQNEYEGELQILEWDPPHRLRTTWGPPSEPLQLTDYLLETRSGRTVLRVVTSGFPTDESWDDWVEGTLLGWRYELASLKHYLEHHDGRDRDVVYLRRRVQLSRETAWQRLFGPGGLDPAELDAQPFDEDPPRQYAAVLDDPPESMLRISTEPCQPGIEGTDVTLFLTAWNGDTHRLEELESRWSRMLKDLYPEGTSP